MRVIVPTPEARSPAFLALRMEGIPVTERWCRRPTDYGATFAQLWDRGKPFLICEWDVVPWPGAVQALLDCDQPRCTHRYPLNRGHLALSFGIGKYVPSGPAPESWAKTEWRLLDGLVVPVLNERLGRPHVHSPPVAHARREMA